MKQLTLAATANSPNPTRPHLTTPHKTKKKKKSSYMYSHAGLCEFLDLQ